MQEDILGDCQYNVRGQKGGSLALQWRKVPSTITNLLKPGKVFQATDRFWTTLVVSHSRINHGCPCLAAKIRQNRASLSHTGQGSLTIMSFLICMDFFREREKECNMQRFVCE